MNERYREKKDSYLEVVPYSEELTEEEQQLDAYLRQFKKEADALYDDNNPYGIIEWNDDEDIHKELYQFCQKLPKGGDLHAHDNTMISFDRFEQIIIDNAMISLSGDTYGLLYTKYSTDLPADAVSVAEALENGSLTRQHLHSMLVMNDQEDGYWQKLERVFSATSDFYSDVSIIEQIYEEGFRSCYERGLLLVEVRDWGVEDDFLNMIRDRCIREAYYRVRKDHPDFLVRIIGCSGKQTGSTVERSCEALRSMIRTSKQLKDDFDPDNVEEFIIGLDLVNEEDNSYPLSDYADFLLSDEVKDSGLHLFLHCGESLRRDNISVVDAYVMKSLRVGHAMNLYRFPKLMRKYVKHHIAIEVCLISNYKLGYVRDLRLHPALQYMIRGIPIVLCSDDGLFMTRQPMIDDFYSAIMCWDLNLSEIKALCRNSITYSGLSQAEIDRLMIAWENRWNSFIAEQLSRFSQNSSL